MNENIVIEIVQNALRAVIVASAPPLIFGLIIGLIVSIFQSVTSIQDATLAFVPKILAVLLAIGIFGPFMLSTIMEFMKELYGNIAIYVG